MFSAQHTEITDNISSNHTSGQGDLIRALFAALIYLLLYFITPHFPSVEWTILGATFLSLPLTLLLAVSIPRALRSSRALALHTLISMLIFLPTVLLPILAISFPSRLWNSFIFLLLPFRWIQVFIPGGGGLILIWTAACIGGWLARLVREPKLLLPIALVLALVDIYTVFGGGIVQQAVQSKPGHQIVQKQAMSSLSMHLPTVKPRGGASPIQLDVGFADYLFIAFFFACFMRLGVPSRAIFLALAATLTIYMMIVFFFDIDLPALVPISIVVIIGNMKLFKYERSELFALLYAGLAILLLTAMLIIVAHR